MAEMSHLVDSFFSQIQLTMFCPISPFFPRSLLAESKVTAHHELKRLVLTYGALRAEPLLGIDLSLRS